ncbi:hypothetical protein AVEN_187163-1, partial [Araneus ventricosus]
NETRFKQHEGYLDGPRNFEAWSEMTIPELTSLFKIPHHTSESRFVLLRMILPCSRPTWESVSNWSLPGSKAVTLPPVSPPPSSHH